MSWWVLSSESLQEMLQRVAAGEDPALIYLEYYANCHVEGVDDAGRTETEEL